MPIANLISVSQRSRYGEGVSISLCIFSAVHIIHHLRILNCIQRLEFYTLNIFFHEIKTRPIKDLEDIEMFL